MIHIYETAETVHGTRPVANKFWNPESLLRHLLFGKIRIRKSCCTKNFWKGFWNPWTRCQRSANQPLEACRIMHPTAMLNSISFNKVSGFLVSLKCLTWQCTGADRQPLHWTQTRNETTNQNIGYPWISHILIRFPHNYHWNMFNAYNIVPCYAIVLPQVCDKL